MIRKIPARADVPIPDYAAALTGEVKGLTIGVPVNWLDDEAPPTAPTKAAFEAALDVFRGLGASVRPVTLPPLQQFDDAKKTIAVAELFTIHAARSAHPAGTVRRQPALPDHRRRPGARRGIHPGDAPAHRSGAGDAGGDGRRSM